MAQGISSRTAANYVRTVPASNLKFRNGYLQVKAKSLPLQSAQKAHTAQKLDLKV